MASRTELLDLIKELKFRIKELEADLEILKIDYKSIYEMYEDMIFQLCKISSILQTLKLLFKDDKNEFGKV